MYACLFLFDYVCMFVYFCMYLCTHVCVYVRMHARVYECECLSVNVGGGHAWTCVPASIYALTSLDLKLLRRPFRCLLWSVVGNFLAVFPSTSCLTIVGGRGCWWLRELNVRNYASMSDCWWIFPSFSFAAAAAAAAAVSFFLACFFFPFLFNLLHLDLFFLPNFA